MSDPNRPSDPTRTTDPDLMQTQWGTSRRATTLAWVVFGLVALLVGRSVVENDFREIGIRGDSAGFVLQAVSIGFDGHNLSYDETDLDYFRSLGWEVEPRGAHIQRNDEGWAFAKPYGYSAFLAPYLRAFGPGNGVALANLTLLTILGAACTATMWLRYRGAVVPIVVGTFLFGSNTFFYAYHAWTELFLAALVATSGYLLLRAVRARSLLWLSLGVVAAAVVVAEKAPLVLVVGPLCLVAILAVDGWGKRAAAVALGAVTFALAIVPYLYYSDYVSWNPYGGDRYYVYNGVPFGGANDIIPVGTNETFSLSYLRQSLGSDIGSTAQSAGYYLVGRHTGVALYMPIAVAIVALSLVVIAKRRRDTPWAGIAMVGGLAAYVAFYVLLFPRNYYGGGQTFGNRYFLQASPIVIAMAVAMGLRVKHLVVASVVSVVVAGSMLWWQFQDPSAALIEIWRTNPLQRFFPVEVNQEYRSVWGDS